MVALETKNKKGFINGSLPCLPITYSLHDAWCRCNRMVMSWLIRSLSVLIKQSVMWMDTARDIWIDLKDRFSHSNIFRVVDLQDQILHCKQGDSCHIVFLFALVSYHVRVVCLQSYIKKKEE